MIMCVCKILTVSRYYDYCFLRHNLLIIQQNTRAWVELRHWPWLKTWIMIRPLISFERTKERIENMEKQLECLEKGKGEAEARNEELEEVGQYIYS